jgi:hypothetical protein
MPNTGISGFYQTLVTETVKASQLMAPSWNLGNSIFWDYSPIAASIGQTLNVVIPVDPTSGVTDPGAGDITSVPIGFTTQQIVFDKHPLFSYEVKDWEQFNSPAIIRNVFADAGIKAVKNAINKSIANLIVTANFPTNLWNGTSKSFNAGTIFYPVTGASGKCLSVSEFLAPSATNAGLFARLSDLNVPVQDDPQNMSVVMPSVPYSRILDATSPASNNDPAWTQAWQAGMNTTQSARQSGVLPVAFGTTFKLDQQMPVTGSAPTRTFTCLYMHRYAIAAVSRPLPPPSNKVVDYEYIRMTPNPDYKDVSPGMMQLPLRVMVGYNQAPKLGYVVTIDAGLGLKVVRESLAIPFVVAE